MTPDVTRVNKMRERRSADRVLEVAYCDFKLTRSKDRFPSDIMFQLEEESKSLRSQFATLNGLFTNKAI